MFEEMGFSSAIRSPMMTTFLSRFPVDSIPLVDMSLAECAPLIDLATIFLLLASYMHYPSPGHLEAAKYVGK